MSKIISVAKTVLLPSISISRRNIFWPFFVDKSIDIFLAFFRDTGVHSFLP